jgi:hypothetical protein
MKLTTIYLRKLLAAVALVVTLAATPIVASYHRGTGIVPSWSRTIPVCWSGGAKMVKDFDTLGPKVQNAVFRGWTQATGLLFKAWETCPQAGTPGYINVGINENPGFDDCAAQTTRLGVRVDVNFTACSLRVTSSDPRGRPSADATILHEFGHALGFEHEVDRPDFDQAPGYNASYKQGWPDCKPPEKIAGGDILHTPPFIQSILNSGYCHTNPDLHYWDVAGAQNKWGRPIYFADLTGDGIDDAIVVNPDGVYVRETDSQGMMPASAQRKVIQTPFWGYRGTFFADVSGPDPDGKSRADMIAVDDAGIYVMKAKPGTGPQFYPPGSGSGYWSGNKYINSRAFYFADVNGDGRADLITVGREGGYNLEVWPSQGDRFADQIAMSLDKVPNNRSEINYFADVTGPDADGKRRADLITLNADGHLYVLIALTQMCPAGSSRR